MNICAVIGNEAHTTSSGWSKLSINGKPVTWRNASVKNWLTKFGDKHASWCECYFEVEPGDRIAWEAGTNSGNRGADRTRIHQVFIADEALEVIELTPLGYPASNAKLAGRIRLEADLLAVTQEKPTL